MLGVEALDAFWQKHLRGLSADNSVIFWSMACPNPVFVASDDSKASIFGLKAALSTRRDGKQSPVAAREPPCDLSLQL